MKKQFITGVVIGGMTFGAAGVFAGQYMATENPFPVQLNGTNISLEGYNINDNTYFKLRDIADAVGGFTVGFENNTIILTSDKESSITTQTQTSTNNTKTTNSYENNPSYWSDLQIVNTNYENLCNQYETEYEYALEENDELREEYRDKIDDLKEDLAEFKRLAGIYENAVTDSGQQKYKEILKDIERTEDKIETQQDNIDDVDTLDDLAEQNYKAKLLSAESAYNIVIADLQAKYSN